MIVNIYNPSWPHERQRLVRVTNEQHSFEHMSYGQFQFDVALNDPLITQAQNPAGVLIGIKSHWGAPDFLGWIERPEASESDAYVTLSGRSWAAILQDRTTEQSRTYHSGDAGAICRDIVYTADARNSIGISVLNSGATLPILSPFELRSDRVMDSINEMYSKAGVEWEIRYEVHHFARATISWRVMVGSDNRHSVCICHDSIIDADYQFDIINDAGVLNIIASSGADRPSVLISDGIPLATLDTAQVRIKSSGRPAQRRGIATSREHVIFDSALPDSLAAQSQIIEELRSALDGREVISLVLAGSHIWSKLHIGDVVMVRLRNVKFSSGPIVRPMRILGMQFEDDSLCEVVGVVVPDAA